MRGALPNPEATLLLLGAVARDKKAYLRKVPKLDYEQNKFGKVNKEFYDINLMKFFVGGKL